MYYYCTVVNQYTLEETEIKPGKYFDTRIKPLPLASSHCRYITATHYSYTRAGTCFRFLMAVTNYNRYKFVTVSILKRCHNDLFNSESALRRLQN